MESALNNLIEKISSYEIFNNVIPVVVYSVFIENLTRSSIRTENNFIIAILFYFIGLVIGRLGSILSDVIGWCFHKLGWKSFLNFASYSEHVQVENTDSNGRIRNLVIMSNMYRTFASLFICLFITILIDRIWPIISVDDYYKITFIAISFILLAILFAFSYRKQTNYITKRISTYKEKNSV